MIVEFKTIALAIAVSAAVCYWSSDVHEGPEIFGLVTLDGRPLAGATVTFLPQSNDPTHPAARVTTAADGRFGLAPDEVTGATLTPGKYAVVVSKVVPRDNVPAELKDDLEQLKAAGLVRESLPARYSRRSKSTLTAEVHLEPNVFQFDLTTR